MTVKIVCLLRNYYKILWAKLIFNWNWLAYNQSMYDRMQEKGVLAYANHCNVRFPLQLDSTGMVVVYGIHILT